MTIHPALLVIQKDLRSVYRDRTAVNMVSIVWILLLIAFITSLLNYRQDQQQRDQANQMFRKQWENQRRNPHDAAHFGTYLFKPLTPVAAFDQGLNQYFGTSLKIEAHKQNELDQSNAENGDAAIRFGAFTIAVVLQLMVPLFLFFMVCTAITQEKESGTLKMLIAQGIKPAQIIWGKVGSGYILILMAVLPLFILMVIIMLFSPFAAQLTGRLLLSLSCYLLYYFLVTIIAVAISVLSSSSRNAMLCVLVIWLVFTLLLPKLAASEADRKYRLMPRAAFHNDLEQGYRNGLNGKDPYYKRGDRYLKQLLAKYHADTISELPLDAGGVIMQQNEDYQNMVFGHYYKQVEGIFAKQQDYLNRFSWFNPFLALKRISMAAAGTDFYHHNDFYNQARRYRNDFIRRLNLEVAAHLDKGHVVYQAGPAFFMSVKNFSYRMPSLSLVLELQRQAVFSILFWVVLMSFILYLITKRPML